MIDSECMCVRARKKYAKNHNKNNQFDWDKLVALNMVYMCECVVLTDKQRLNFLFERKCVLLRNTNGHAAWKADYSESYWHSSCGINFPNENLLSVPWSKQKNKLISFSECVLFTWNHCNASMIIWVILKWVISIWEINSGYEATVHSFYRHFELVELRQIIIY